MSEERRPLLIHDELAPFSWSKGKPVYPSKPIRPQEFAAKVQQAQDNMQRMHDENLDPWHAEYLAATEKVVRLIARYPEAFRQFETEERERASQLDLAMNPLRVLDQRSERFHAFIQSLIDREIREVSAQIEQESIENVYASPAPTRSYTMKARITSTSTGTPSLPSLDGFGDEDLEATNE